jgi:hypothetical protein
MMENYKKYAIKLIATGTMWIDETTKHKAILQAKDILEEIGLTHMIVENIEESDEPADCCDHGNHPDRE